MSSNGMRHGPTRRATAAPIGVVARRLMVTLYVSAACLGSLTVSLVSALFEAFFAVAFGSALCLSVYRSFTESWPSAATLRTWATVSFVAPLYVHGVRALGDLGLVVTLTIVVLALVRLREMFGDEAPAGRAPATGSSEAGGVADDTSLTALLAGLPLDALLEEWHDCGGRGSDDDAVEVRRLREEIVGELWRRNPEGTKRWLESGATDPPERYVRPDPGGDP
jgi:hypothetical protein